MVRARFVIKHSTNTVNFLALLKMVDDGAKWEWLE